MFSTALSCIIALFLWPLFIDKPFINDFGDWLSLSIFVVTCSGISFISGAVRRSKKKIKMAEDHLRKTNDELENRVKERTALLTESEERYRSTLDNMMEGCQIISSEWKYLYLNDTADKHNRRTKEELLGKRYMDMWPGIESTEVFRVIKHCMEERVVRHMENEFVFPDGKKGWFELRIEPIPEGVFILSVDITERKKAEGRQNLSSEILSILNYPSDFTDTIDRILSAIKHEMGFDAVSLRLLSGDDYPYIVQKGFSDDFLLTENSLTVRDNKGPCRDENGKLCLECTCGVVISGKTDQSNPLFTEGGSAWTNNSLTLLNIPADKDPRLNPRNNCIHEGYNSVALIPIRADNEIVGLLQLNDRKKDRFTLEIIHFYERITESIGVALKRKQSEEEIKRLNAELEIKVAERTNQLAETNKNLCNEIDEKNRLLQVIEVNQLELKAQNEELQRKKDNINLLIESTAEGIYGIDLGGNCTFCNPSCVAILGYESPDQFLGKKMHYLIHHTGADGKRISVEECNVYKAFLKGEKHHSDTEIFWKADGNCFPVEYWSYPILNKGKISGAVITFIDISERKQLEEDTIRNLELEKELNLLKSRFISVISHEFRTPLTGIQSSVQLFERYGDKWEKEKKQKFFDTIYKSVRFANLLLDDVSIIGKDEGGKLSFNPSICAIDELSLQAVNDIKAVFGDQHHIDFSVRPESIQAMADESLLRHIINNLLSNAVKYSGTEEQVEFSVVAENNNIVFTFIDYGIGIPDEDMKHIFESFHRASNVESIKGTGLGLSIVKRCVEIHKGTIEISSELNKGTTVVVKIPYMRPEKK